MGFLTDTQRWEAVVGRNRAAAHHFYYAVKTTGIYCVAGCASRLPRRENVLFFESRLQAETAGFRPCKRCRPDDPAHADMGSRRVIDACRAIEAADSPIPLDDLAQRAGLSLSHFQRLFKERVGLTPKEYAHAVQDRRVRDALEKGRSVTRAIHDAGFGSASRFYARSVDALGMDARQYGKGGAGLTIRHAEARSFLGLILVGVTERGVCSIEFGTDRDALIQALRDRFPNASIEDGGEELGALVQEVVAFIDSPQQGFDVPLDIQGTAFQQRVWKELRDIPCGETRTYTEIAEALGAPRSVRAVATACAANLLAVVVPCHRVIRKSGALAGYRWGLELKKALLEREK